jgi:ArsR family metal-binding transcriptional regulator
MTVSNEVLVFEVGDRFATITDDGKAVIWQVDDEGIPQSASGNMRLKSMQLESREGQTPNE